MKSSGVRGQSAVSEVERRIGDLVAGLLAGRRPSSEDVVSLQANLATLSESDARVPAGKIAKFHGAVRELADYVLLPKPSAPVVVPDQRHSKTAKAAARVAVAPSKLDVRFDCLRKKVDTLHDAIEAGRRPSLKTFDDVQADLVAFRRMSDGPEIRQMINDVRGFRRSVVKAAQPPKRARAASSRRGRGFWGQPVARPIPPTPKRRRGSSGGAGTKALSPEQTRLVEQSRSLRERADRFAAAVPSGRTLPQRESDQLFLHFKLLRPQVNHETQALNDAAVRRLTEAVVEVRRRASG